MPRLWRHAERSGLLSHVLACLNSNPIIDAAALCVLQHCPPQRLSSLLLERRLLFDLLRARLIAQPPPGVDAAMDGIVTQRDSDGKARNQVRVAMLLCLLLCLRSNLVFVCVYVRQVWPWLDARANAAAHRMSSPLDAAIFAGLDDAQWAACARAALLGRCEASYQRQIVAFCRSWVRQATPSADYWRATLGYLQHLALNRAAPVVARRMIGGGVGEAVAWSVDAARFAAADDDDDDDDDTPALDDDDDEDDRAKHANQSLVLPMGFSTSIHVKTAVTGNDIVCVIVFVCLSNLCVCVLVVMECDTTYDLSHVIVSRRAAINHTPTCNIAGKS
jgi:hypothetical protein